MPFSIGWGGAPSTSAGAAVLGGRESQTPITGGSAGYGGKFRPDFGMDMQQGEFDLQKQGQAFQQNMARDRFNLLAHRLGMGGGDMGGGGGGQAGGFMGQPPTTSGFTGYNFSGGTGGGGLAGVGGMNPYVNPWVTNQQAENTRAEGRAVNQMNAVAGARGRSTKNGWDQQSNLLFDQLMGHNEKIGIEDPYQAWDAAQNRGLQASIANMNAANQRYGQQLSAQTSLYNSL